MVPKLKSFSVVPSNLNPTFYRMTTFPEGKLHDFFRYYDPSNPNHVEAVRQLQVDIKEADDGLLTDLAPWVQLFRAPIEIIQPAEKVDNSWGGIVNAARKAGAKFPELVAAQWGLESGFGKYPAAPNNFWGIKGFGRNPSSFCTQKETKEFINGEWITTCAWFRNFASIEEGVQYVVNRWYKDYKNFKGVNRAATRQEAARLLVTEGYATDPDYAGKLIKLMDQYAGPSVAVAPKEINLPVPFFSQLDSETSQGSRMCFSSTCAMAVDFLCPGLLKGDQKDDFYLHKVNEYGDTTDPYAQIYALDTFGLNAEFRQDLDVSNVEAQLLRGYPVPIGVLHHGPVTNPSGGGHWILIVGMGEDYFLVNDPFGEMNLVNGGYVQHTHGDHLKYSHKNLLPRWTVEGSCSGWGILFD